MKRTLFFMATLLAALQLSASVIDAFTAQSTAQRFASGLAADGRHRSPQRGTSAVLVHTEASQAMPGQAVYYIFNTDDSYIIVPGDDRAEEVLAYGDAPIDMNDIPCAMQCWLDGYKEQMEYLLSHPGLEVKSNARMAPKRQHESVEPLLTALWDQGYPYNLECPTSGGSRCITGCPATSLSMVFHYWKYPTDTTPSVPGYVTNSLELRLQELPPTTFDWANMLDSYRYGYSQDQARAVAHLMRYLGQAEEMDYTPQASGSYGENILETAILFGYNPDAELIYKTTWWDTEDYTDEEWAYIIQEELFSQRPLVMCAYANSAGGLSGHAFNVDGYDGERDMYHVNWGWSGSGNAYFALNAFRGGSGTYNLIQQIIVGLEPPATVPTIRVNRTRLSVSSYVDRTTDISFRVKGELLTDDVNLTLNDESGSFALQNTMVNVDETNDGKLVTVSFTPKATGEYSATITLSSENAKDVKVIINGTAILETYDPVMLEASDVEASSFQVNWTDETPSHNVTWYNLEIGKLPYSELCMQQTFNHIVDNTSSDYSQHLDEVTSTAGWTGSKVYQGNGYLRLGNSNYKGWLKTPGLDMRDSKGLLSVTVSAKCVNNDNSALLTISTDDSDTTITVLPEESDYNVLLPCANSKDVKVRLSNSVTARRVLITGVKVYAGDAISSVDTATIRYHEGISGTSYKLIGMEPSIYSMRIQAAYTDGNLSSWSNRMNVTVNGAVGDLNSDGTINIADINILINVVLGNTASRRTINASDINGDGVTNIADVNALINIILNDL